MAAFLTSPVPVRKSTVASTSRLKFRPRGLNVCKKRPDSCRLQSLVATAASTMSTDRATKSTLICTSLTATSVQGQLDEMKSALADGADLAEVRIDYLTGSELSSWKDILTARCLPVIVTNRASWEGGNWLGSEDDRLAILSEAESLGAEYIDVELAASEEFSQVREDGNAKAKLILSHHNFSEAISPQELSLLQKKMTESGADIHKFAMMATSASDLCTVFEVLRSATVPTIALAMGELGQASRVAAGKFGAFLTFASVGDGRESAPGQVATRYLSEFFRFGQTSSSTRLFAIIGNPVSHSMSPAMHNAAMSSSGIDGLYVYVPVDTNVEGVIRGLCQLGFDGFSVTIPYKVDALCAADEVDSVAEEIGAINTIVRRDDGTLAAFNTDWVAAMDAIEEGLPSGSLEGLRVVCIGAGGAGRALSFGALSRGARELIIVNRSAPKAVALAKEIGENRAVGLSLTEFSAASDTNFDVVINSTSVGMHPNVEETPVPRELLRNRPLVFDAVYNPLETRLLRDAAEMRCTTVSGLEMFVRQGVEQFRLWHPDVVPPVDVMRRVVLDRLNLSSEKDA